MLKKSLSYGTGLIALYLVVYNASGSGRVFTAGANGLTTVVKGLQGR